MGLIKSLFNATRANPYAFDQAVIYNNQIQELIGHKTTVSPTELNETVRMVTLDDKITQAVMKAVGFNDLSDAPKVINHNKIFAAMLKIMDKRAKEYASK